MIEVATTYQSSEPMNTGLRPRRSAAWLNITTPTHRPAKVQNTKVPKPAIFSAESCANTPSEAGVNNPDFSMPGAT